MPAFDPNILRPLVVSVESAAGMLGMGGVSKSQLCRLIRRNDFPAPFKMNGRLVVAVADLESLVERKRAMAPAELEQRRAATAPAIQERQRKRQERKSARPPELPPQAAHVAGDAQRAPAAPSIALAS